MQVGRESVLITRNRKGEARANFNVCRHRGATLCTEESGEVRRAFQCPYHAWTYDLDGSLRAAPRSDREPGFAREELGLVPVAVDTWGPFVFVNPDPDAAPLADDLGELPDLLGADGMDVGALRFLARKAV